MFKKVISLFVGCVVAFGLCSCEKSSLSSTNSGKYNVVCTIFPEYDWTREIIGDHEKDFNVYYLLESGVDLHNFQPTADDISKISDCDIFIYVGGESDSWTNNAIAEASNKNMKVINLMEILGDGILEKEELVNGTVKEEAAAEYEYDENGERHKIKKAIEYDEHVWLSLKNAELFCENIAEAISALDPSNKADYQHNLEEYNSKLEALDEQYTQMFKSTKASDKTLIFGDRFPFLYFFDDYNLNYFAAFTSCSSDTKATNDTISFLAKKVDFLKSDNIFVTETSNGVVAKSIIQNTQEQNQGIIMLNALQSVTKEQIKNGTTYISVMLDNYDILRKVFNYDD